MAERKPKRIEKLCGECAGTASIFDDGEMAIGRCDVCERKTEIVILKEPYVEAENQCRECGCTDASPCIGANGEPCSWTKPDLCSACAT